MNKESVEKWDVVVIGGSAAGVTAAITARRHYPQKRVLILRKEKQVSIPCGIPYIYGTLGSPEKNLIPDSLLEANKIDLKVATAHSLQRAEKTVTTSEGTIGYDRAILATGSQPIRPGIPGIELNGVFAIEKDVEHLGRLKNQLEKAKNVTVIGGGFIGIEFADEINKIGGKNVTIVEMQGHCLNLAYDEEFCIEMEKLLESRGVKIMASARVKALEGKETIQAVLFEDSAKLQTDLLILGIGSKVNSELAQKSGLQIGETGGVWVDRNMRTSDPSIFACGDCAEKIYFFGGHACPLKLASIATLEARIAGANLFGTCRESSGTLGVWCTAVGPMALGTAGLTETTARKLGYKVVCSSLEGPNRHPGGMPDMAPTKLKLVFETNSGLLLGGQIRGGSSVGEMTNLIAACIQKKMTQEDIATFQMGTHPALTASPIAYPIVNAAEMAGQSLRKKE